MSSTDNKKTTKTDNFTSNMEWILLAVSKGRERVATISKMTNKDRSNVYRTLKILTREGYIIKESETKSYFPTEKGYKKAVEIATPQVTTKSSQGSMSDNVSGTNGVKPLLRGEKIGLKLKILEKPKDWGYNRRQIFMEKNFTNIKSKEMNNWEEVRFYVDDVLVKTSDSNLLFHCPKKEYMTPVEAQLDLMRVVFDLKGRFERKLGIKLADSAQFVGMELADLEDLEGAGQLGEFTENKNYVVWHDPKTGKERLIFDSSPGNWEFEYKMAEWSFDDATEILRRRADEVLHPNSPLTSELAVKQESTESLLNDAAKITKTNALHIGHFGEHMRTHVSVLQKMDKTLEKLNKRLDDDGVN